jgi:asparagine synthase (glutamine-hydrolysing)
MSAIGGGCYLKPERSKQELSQLLNRCLQRTGPDGGKVLIDDHAVIGHRAFHISAMDWESNCQPIAWNNGLVLAWDGRLDNRGELKSQLETTGPSDSLSSNCTCDAHLVMRSFVKWGEAFIGHLVGDFALSLWDPQHSTLYLGRDPFGIRPLYLLHNGQEVWWASDIAFLLAVADRKFQLDEEYVAGYLTFTEDPHRTPYLGINSVSPGTLAIIKEGHFSQQQFWSPEPKQQILYRTDREYEEHFQALFADSLRCRLHAKGPVMAELSGGLDSSAIVCMADKLLRTGEAEASGLETVSFVYDQSRTADETLFMEQVLQATGVVNHRIVDHGAFAFFAKNDGYCVPNPHRTFLHTFLQTAECMRSSGARVLLTGTCGDHLFMHRQAYCAMLAELLSQGQLLNMHGLAAWLSRDDKMSYWQTLWLGAIWPWLPLHWRTVMSPPIIKLPDWIAREFARRTQISERGLLREQARSIRNPCLGQRINLIHDAISASSSCRYREHLCVEASMPYLHRPLVEFVLEVPAGQLLRVGEDRSLQRRAMDGILPETIRTRKTKRGPAESLLRGIRKQWPDLAACSSNSILARLGIVSQTGFQQALEQARCGYSRHIGTLYRALSCEMWLAGEVAQSRLAL